MMPLDWSQESLGFLAYWKSLRARGEFVPAAQTLHDIPSPTHVRSTSAAQITSTGAMMYFIGAAMVERWGVDITGRDIHSFRDEEFKQRALLNIHRFLARPCGNFMRVSFVTTRDLFLGGELLFLPLSTPEGTPQRFVYYANVVPPHEPLHLVHRAFKTYSSEWVDIGAGVPLAAPLSLVDFAPINARAIAS
jgi:hypothetical protein